MLQSEDKEERRKSVELLRNNFSVLPDKKQAWKDLIQLMQEGGWSLGHAIGLAFPLIPDKEQAWADLHRLTQDENVDVQSVFALEATFPHIPNKKQAWDDLYRLAQGKPACSMHAAKALGSAFSHISDKKQAWDDLHRLTKDISDNVRVNAAIAISAAFPYIPYKKQAWEDLHRLVQDEVRNVQWSVAHSLGNAFSHLPDKKQAWEDLHRLTQDRDFYTRLYAAEAIGAAFPHIPNKKQAWEDLHFFTQDKDFEVLLYAIVALGTAFPYIPDKKQAWEDLHRLTQHGYSDVQAFANHSLGMASIFKATEAESENELRKELEKALEFFEWSTIEATYFNIAGFCLQFYRLFYAITFEKQDAESEVQKYLAGAKNAVKGSEGKEKLLEAVENLANALTEAQKARDKGFENIKNNLDAYRRYCERAVALLETTEEKAPVVTKLIRKGLPIIDKKIKGLLREIEEKTKKFCKESQGTHYEKISRSAYDSVRGFGEIENPVVAVIRLDRITPLLHRMCNILPEGGRGVICSQLDEIKEAELPDKANIVLNALSCIMVQQENMKEMLAEKDKRIEYLEDKVLPKLDNISYGVSKLKLRSGEIVRSLHEIQNELDKVNYSGLKP